MNIDKQLNEPKCVVVTGAQGGIGKAIVNQLEAQNINVVSVDIAKATKTISCSSTEHTECDISNPLQVEAFWSTLSHQGIVVDCLINNAGIYPGCLWHDYTPELAYQVLNINVMGAFMMSQRFAHQTTSGTIINISSVSAFTGSSDPIYGASKAALIGLTKSMAISLAPHIRVNAIAPSIVMTSMMNNIKKEILERYQQRELLTPTVESEAIANAAFFLASNASKHITGSVIDVNNGIYLR